MTEEIKTEGIQTKENTFGLSSEEVALFRQDLAKKKEKEEQEKKFKALLQDDIFKTLYEGSETFKSEIDTDKSILNNEKALALLMKSAKHEVLKPKEEPKPQELKTESTKRPMYQQATPNQEEQEIREGDKRTVQEVSTQELASILQNTYGLGKNEAYTRALNLKVMQG